MATKSIIHKFNYTPEDIVNLIKYDIARQLEMETLPIIDYKINFHVTMEDRPDDWRAEFSQVPTFKGANAEVEMPS